MSPALELCKGPSISFSLNIKVQGICLNSSKMKFSVPVIALLVSTAVAQQVNRKLTNGWGSTPAQRHYINASQALTVINAAVGHSNSIG